MHTAARRAALLIGHPAHVLRVYEWMRQMHPSVCVLTDGSGATGVSNLERSSQILCSLGASTGTVFGRFSDAGIYQAILDGEIDLFTDMVAEIAEAWIHGEITTVASDANEGFSPTHDLCCEIAKAAVERVHQQTDRVIEHYVFFLSEWEFPQVASHPMEGLRLRLDDLALQEKIAAARGFCEVREEVDRALALKGQEYFRQECLMPCSGWATEDPAYKPFYEQYGERRVREGKYATLLRYREHMLPLFRALRSSTLLDAATSFPGKTAV